MFSFAVKRKHLPEMALWVYIIVSLNFFYTQKSLIMIIGPVGSGKVSLKCFVTFVFGS